MHRFLILLLFCLPTIVTAQITELTLSISPNYTFINDQKNDLRIQQVPIVSGYTSQWITVGNNHEKYTGSLGSSISFLIGGKVTNKLSLTSGLSILHSNFRRVDEITGGATPGRGTAIDLGSFNNNQYPPIGNVIVGIDTARITSANYNWVNSYGLTEKSEDVGRTNAVYLQIPILVGITLFKNKLSVKGGTTVSFLAYTSVVKMSTSFTSSYYYSLSTSEYTDTSSDGFANALLSGQINIAYPVYKSLCFETSYQQFITPLFDESNRFAGKARLKSLSFGLLYYFKKVSS
jgi:hypothetical protein